MPAPTRTARPETPWSEEDIHARYDCRCPLLPGTHPAGMCAHTRENTTTTNGGDR